MIGIIVCDSNEFKDLGIKINKTIKKGTFTFMETKINNKDVVIVLSGIGIVQATAATQSLLENYPSISVLYNYGAVGANNSLKIYDIILPKHIYYADVQSPWYDFGQIPNQPKYFKNKLVDKNILDNNIATSMKFLYSKQMTNEIEKNINVSIYDMEIAAIANVANNWNIPLGIVKCVSDIIGNDDTSNLENINDRIKNAGKKAFNILLKKLSKHN